MAWNAETLTELLVHQQPALRIFLVRCAGPDAWEDLYQNLWIRIQRVTENPPIRDGKAFLFDLARKVALDHGRAEGRRRRLHVDIQYVLWGPDYGPPLDVAAISREEFVHLLATVAALPEPTRTIFSLNRLENITQREVASRVGLSQTSVEKHISRALKMISLARAEKSFE